MSSSSGTPMGNVQGGSNPLAPPPPQYYQSQQMRYTNPMSVQSAPSPAPINSPMIPMQQQQQQQSLAPPYQSINSPMQTVNQQNYQHNLNSPLASQIPQHIQSPMMPQSVQSQHIYSPMPSNSQLNSNLNSPLTHSYQINSPMPNQSPITANTSQQHYQSMSHNSPLPPLTPQQQYHQQMHHSSSSIPSTPTMMVNSPYNNNNNSYNQYNHHYQNHDQFNTSSNYQSQNLNSHNYDLNYTDNTDYYNQQYMIKQQQQQQQQQMKERERELEKEREIKERELNEKQQRKRFLVELEFVQCLANPNYLHYLAKEGMFDNDAFKNYLKYLLYWKRPEYIQFIKYPECLFFLDLLQNDDLQQMIKDKNCVHFICEQQMLNWKYNNESFMKTVKTLSNESTSVNETKTSEKLPKEQEKIVESLKPNIKIPNQKSKSNIANTSRLNAGFKQNSKS